MGLTRSSFMRTMAFQSATKFLPGCRGFLGSLEFLTNKFGNLSLQELEFSKVTGSGTGRFPPTLARVGLVSEAQLALGSLGKRIRISLREVPITPWLPRQPLQIQSTHRHQNLTLSMTEKSTWGSRVVSCQRKPPKSSNGRLRKR
jgi:hypothetical protein